MMSLCRFHQHFFPHHEWYSVSGATGYSGDGGADGDVAGDGGYLEIFLVQAMKIHGRSQVEATSAFSLCSIYQKGHLRIGSNGRL
jgi:hypothetical protein